MHLKDECHSAPTVVIDEAQHFSDRFLVKLSSFFNVAFDCRDYADFDALLVAIDSLETEHGGLDFRKGDRVNDLEEITAEFLTNHIDHAFKAWRERPWAQFLSFDQFCQYVLPYRGSNKPLEQWRPYYWEKYGAIDDSLADPTDPAAAAVAINRDVRSWFGFDQRWYYHPADQGHSEMLESGRGRCEDMTNITIYALRANGLAVTSDYTPHWGNANGNHAWNSILLPDGEVVPFMGAEADPGSYCVSVGTAHSPYVTPSASSRAQARPPVQRMPR